MYLNYSQPFPFGRSERLYVLNDYNLHTSTSPVTKHGIASLNANHAFGEENQGCILGYACPNMHAFNIKDIGLTDWFNTFLPKNEV